MDLLILLHLVVPIVGTFLVGKPTGTWNWPYFCQVPSCYSLDAL